MMGLVGFCRAMAQKSPLVLRTARSTVPRQSIMLIKNLQSQSKLPQLPVPPLHKTLDKYLRTVRPLVTDEEFNITKALVSSFGAPGGIGEKLQSLLEKKYQSTENWLAEWWLNVAYLDYRLPVTVYSSPGLVFPLQKFSSVDEQLQYAAKMIAGALDYKGLVDSHAIPIERIGKDPVDMSQYYKIFGTCRMPGKNRDVLHFADPRNPPNHIIVSHNNHFFKVIVLADNGKPYPWKTLLEQLKEVLNQSVHPAQPLGILTSENRSTWAKACEQLSKDAVNRDSLKAIVESLFLVCIDGPNPDLGNVNFQTKAALQTVHGNGSQGNSGNRWFDKTVQFVVGNKGEVGLTYEHSPAEGPPIANLMDHIVDYMSQISSESPASDYPKPKRLKFNISDSVQETLETAKENIDTLAEDLEMACFTFKGYGKDFIKSQRLSPDSFIQMAIQFAFYRLHKEPGAHYETASTRKYLHGRTETIRSCSIESVAFAQTMLGETGSKTNEEKVKALKEAVESHKQYTIEAVNGFGVDRHLFGLKLLAIENGMDIPKLFLDTGFIRSSHMRLSSSQVAAKCDSFMCYGPLVPDGYGCCYNPRPKEINFGTSAFRSSPDTNSAKFAEALQASFTDMHDVLLSSQKSKL